MSKTRAGFTLIELLTVIAIIGILAGMVVVNTTAARQRGRYARALGDMKNIAAAAEQHYYQNQSKYAGDVGPNTDPAFVPNFLNSWPTPPCSGWTYDWENWLSGEGIIRITLRNADPPYGKDTYYYCIVDPTDPTDPTSPGCDHEDGSSPIQNVNKLTCNE